MVDAEKKVTVGLDRVLEGYFNESARAIEAVNESADTLKSMVKGIFESQKKGGRLLIGGNGGSCADAEHFAGEMVCTFNDRDRRSFSALSLTGNPSAITAWANDFGFESYFIRQVEAHGTSGDILFLITTGGGDRENGASMNLEMAAEKAKEMGLKVYSIAGKTGGELSKISDEFIKVKSFSTSHIQEAHIAIIHAICTGLDELDLADRGDK